MRFILLTFLLISVLACGSGTGSADGLATAAPDRKLLALSQDLLYAVKTEKPTVDLERSLSGMSAEDLSKGLPDDRSRNLFWVNMYNAWYQLFAVRDGLDRPKIFTHRGILFKGFSLTLDDIEHGILRRYRSKYSLGYLPQLLPAQVIKDLAVRKPDFRIHFALNCGARSCPPIAFYEYDLLEEQFDLAAKTFLNAETTVDDEKKLVFATRIMEWFSADFGGKSGQLKILSSYLGRDLSGYSIRYRDDDWTDALMNFGEAPRG
ncbi:MAG: DUF547 domain-containing protein, partial [Bacteroidota bacterium]